jgi:hypothetical protein
VTFIVLVSVATLLFSCFGWAKTTNVQQNASVNLESGEVAYTDPESTPVSLWTGLEFSLRESIALLPARSLPLHTTGAGTALDIVLRLAGPVLLAFIVLALRARTKR